MSNCTKCGRDKMVLFIKNKRHNQLLYQHCLVCCVISELQHHLIIFSCDIVPSVSKKIETCIITYEYIMLYSGQVKYFIEYSV